MNSDSNQDDNIVIDKSDIKPIIELGIKPKGNQVTALKFVASK